MNFSLFLTIFISETLGTVAFPGVHGYKTSYGPLLMEHTLCISKKQKQIFGELPMTTIMMMDIIMHLPLEYDLTAHLTKRRPIFVTDLLFPLEIQ